MKPSLLSKAKAEGNTPCQKRVEDWCDLHRLIDELSLVQSRLGTPLERDNDYQSVRTLGHDIRNKLQRLQLWSPVGVDLPDNEVGETLSAR